MNTVHLIISGFVQRVGFRQFVKENAKRLDLKGWVRNTQDRKVEAVLQGSQAKIDEMVACCRKGPFLAEVKNIEIKKIKGEDFFSDFIVLS